MRFMFLILALAQRPGEKALAVYLAIMVAGSGFMIVVAVGGLIRNLLVFPLSKRGQDPFSGELRAAPRKRVLTPFRLG